MKKKAYKRIMLKFSGEVLAGKGDEMIDFDVLERLCKEIVDLHKKKYEIAVVVGGGNIWRYRDNTGKGIPRVESDFLGMMATVMNGVAMRSVFERLGVEARVVSALPVAEVAEPYVRRRALAHLEKGHIVICTGGTGRPFFTTDSGAALRALELNCDVFLKATKVDGVYDSDPMKNKKAKKFDTISFDKVLEKRLAFMDSTASALCREGGVPVIVFDLMKKGNLSAAAAGKKVGTLVHV
ncbi:MAG: UMP kinase [Candidatus Peregrinibacteria bacterium]|nr:UMP kinase [Candidatus Peregrinibacteria bacterium]